LIGFPEVAEAARRLDGIAHRTPIITSRTLDRTIDGHAVLKAENFQRGGAFKFRGAYNMISSISDADRRAGVATYSSGNHAQAVALAAQLLGTRAVILMPQDAPAAKVEATRSYGAEIVFYDRYTEDRTALGAKLAADRGMTLVPPYDHPLIIAGQGTAALELCEEAGPPDAIVVPVGGGGLISGCAIAARHLNPGVRVIGVEPESGDDTRQSLAAGRRVRIPVPQTIADGQQVDTPGELTFEIMTTMVDDVVTVSDDDIIDAMRFCLDYLKIVVEPSGASGLAALLAGSVNASGTIGVVLSGGNVGAARLAELLARAG
jgi:threo-3-hydroxy-L-aspartate ammonia-lyase